MEHPLPPLRSSHCPRSNLPKAAAELCEGPKFTKQTSLCHHFSSGNDGQEPLMHCTQIRQSSLLNPASPRFLTTPLHTHAGHPAPGAALALQEMDEGEHNNDDCPKAPPAPGGSHSARPSVSGEGSRGRNSNDGGNGVAQSDNGSNQDDFG